MNSPLDRKPIPDDAKKVFQGEIFSVWQWPQKLFDGSLKTFEKVQRPDAAFVLGTLPDKKILLIQDEQPDRQAVITIPGGKIEVGETPAEAATRELLEETGYQVETVVPWFVHQLPGKVIATFHMFIGKGLIYINEARPEAGERITLQPVSFEDFFSFVEKEVERFSPLRVMVLEMMLDPNKKKDFYQLLYG